MRKTIDEDILEKCTLDENIIRVDMVFLFKIMFWLCLLPVRRRRRDCPDDRFDDMSRPVDDVCPTLCVKRGSGLPLTRQQSPPDSRRSTSPSISGKLQMHAVSGCEHRSSLIPIGMQMALQEKRNLKSDYKILNKKFRSRFDDFPTRHLD